MALLLEPLEANPPIFGNMSELATAIAELRELRGAENPYGRARVPSTTSLLAQICRGKKPCPRDLGIAIELATQQRLKGARRRAYPADFFERVRKATLYGIGSALRPGHVPDARFRALLQRGEESPRQVIITGTPAEGVMHPAAVQLDALLIRRLGLHADGNADPDAQYVFCLPAQIGHKWWEELLARIVNNNPAGGPLGARTAIELLRQAHEENRLQVYKTDAHLCGCPTVIFWEALDGNIQPSTAFVLFYYDRSEVGAAEFGLKSFEYFMESTYPYFLRHVLQDRNRIAPTHLSID